MRARNRPSCSIGPTAGSGTTRRGAHPGTSRPTEPESSSSPGKAPPAPGLSRTRPRSPAPWPRPTRQRCRVRARESGAGASGRCGAMRGRAGGGATGAVAAGKPGTYPAAAALRLLGPGVCSRRNRRPRGSWKRGSREAGAAQGPARSPAPAPPAGSAPIGRSRHRPRPGRVPGSRGPPGALSLARVGAALVAVTPPTA